FGEVHPGPQRWRCQLSTFPQPDLGLTEPVSKGRCPPGEDSVAVWAELHTIHNVPAEATDRDHGKVAVNTAPNGPAKPPVVGDGRFTVGAEPCLVENRSVRVVEPLEAASCGSFENRCPVAGGLEDEAAPIRDEPR